MNAGDRVMVEAATTMLDMMREVAVLAADRDRWKADAFRLATAARYVPSWNMPFSGDQSNDWRNLRAALSAHDALVEGEGK